MFVIRPARLDDLPKLIQLLDTLEHSLTSMPQDKSILEKRIHKSIQSFYPGVSEAGSEEYLFMLENLSTGKLIGTSGVIARIGGYEPFYTYRIVNEAFEHPPLQISKNIDVLHLDARHDGPSELGSLYLHPQFRKNGLGKLLSLSRIMFMARFPKRFRNHLIAELRGWVDENSRSPFWDCVGRHFFEREFDEADFLSGIGDKAFIKDLMPDYPIYLPLLPEFVQSKIGQVHPDTEPAMAILLKEGFDKTNAVDIFDAGPMLQGQLDSMRIPKTLRHLPAIPEPEELTPGIKEMPFIVSNSALEYRCCIQNLPTGCGREDTIHLPENIFKILQIHPGDFVDIVPLKPQTQSTL